MGRTETEKPLVGRPEKHQEVEQPLLHGRAGFLVTVAQATSQPGRPHAVLRHHKFFTGPGKDKNSREVFSQLEPSAREPHDVTTQPSTQSQSPLTPAPAAQRQLQEAPACQGQESPGKVLGSPCAWL